MVITWQREGCFRIVNGDISITTDTPTKESGLTIPRAASSIYIKTLTAVSTLSEPSDEKANFVIQGAGEYDMHNVRVRGHQLVGESTASYIKTVYVIQWDDISIGLLGHVSQDIVADVKTDFEELDVLIAPGGGDPFMEVKKMTSLIKQLNPKIVIPSFYKIGGLKRKSGDVKDFLSQFNGDTQQEEKLVFKKKDITDIKKTKVICLKP